ncbi:MAG TPA: hypothetical protein VNL94_10245 [Candidatus Binatia bacterium]|nr:hypothetical protein [Candidatus Binatia bacterium]
MTRRRRVVRAAIVVLLAIVAVEAVLVGQRVLRDIAETVRTTPRYDPPVMAGQNVTGACSGGFYARRGETIVLTISAHCSRPGDTLRDGSGRVIGVIGQRAELADCPPGRFCAPSDFMPLELAPDRIPWGHLNEVDLGAGGYRTFDASTRALACGDMAVGGRVEFNGRERYRTGKVTEIGPYEHETDTIFPCMVVADVSVFVGDSGAAVLVDGQPAGVVARHLGGWMGFTPLAEGLENLGLALCTTPNCDLTPPSQ